MREKFNHFDKELGNIKEETKGIKDEIHKVNERVTYIEKDVGEVLEKIAKRMSIIANKMTGTTTEAVNQNNSDHAYDIQQQSMAVAREKLPAMLDKETLDAAKTQALKHGIPLDSMLDVIAILLRNKILEEKGIHLDEVDKNDPEQIR